MTAAILNLDALRHNAVQTAKWADKLKVGVLPILKGIRSHPLAVGELCNVGFNSFGFSECAEFELLFSEGPTLLGSCNDRVLIQISPVSRAKDIPLLFGRSFQSQPETISVINLAAAEAGIKHDIMIMMDVGEQREGVSMEDLPVLLEYTAALANINVAGFALTLGCQGTCLPDASFALKLDVIRDIFQSKGLYSPDVSVGGSVFCRWLEDYGTHGITEIRLGANFILGEDTYRNLPLPGGELRSDVCLLEAEVLEVTQRIFSKENTPAMSEQDGYPVVFSPFEGKRRCALLDAGRLHAKFEDLECLLSGAHIVGISSKYMIIDITDCAVSLHAGSKVLFRIGYWTMARLFHSSLVSVVPVRDSTLKL